MGFRMRGLREQSSGLGIMVDRLKSQQENVGRGSRKRKKQEHHWLEETKGLPASSFSCQRTQGMLERAPTSSKDPGASNRGEPMVVTEVTCKYRGLRYLDVLGLLLFGVSQAV